MYYFRTDSAKELYTSLNETNTMITSLDTQINTLETLKEGNVPEAPKPVIQPIEVKEPIVTTVEVKSYSS